MSPLGAGMRGRKPWPPETLGWLGMAPGTEEGPQSSRGPHPLALPMSLKRRELVLPNCDLTGNRDSPWIPRALEPRLGTLWGTRAAPTPTPRRQQPGRTGPMLNSDTMWQNGSPGVKVGSWGRLGLTV